MDGVVLNAPDDPPDDPPKKATRARAGLVQKFQPGDRVKLKPSAREMEEYVRESTRGRFNDVYEVLSYFPAVEIRGEYTPPAYLIRHAEKRGSGCLINELDLRLTRSGSTTQPS